jgi:hypothetical protein
LNNNEKIHKRDFLEERGGGKNKKLQQRPIGLGWWGAQVGGGQTLEKNKLLHTKKENMNKH